MLWKYTWIQVFQKQQLCLWVVIQDSKLRPWINCTKKDIETPCAAILHQVPYQYLIEAPSIERFANLCLVMKEYYPLFVDLNNHPIKWMMACEMHVGLLLFTQQSHFFGSCSKSAVSIILHVLPFSQLSWLEHGRVNQDNRWTIKFWKESGFLTWFGKDVNFRWWSVYDFLYSTRWFRPIWKISYSQIGSFPQVGMKIKTIWNHHIVVSLMMTPTKQT